ncbi:MAG: nucleotidyltransferase family protein [Eubacteriales bacterium]|nr:nucleotidyltransferase family protein [Eubacteriales bacterium]
MNKYIIYLAAGNSRRFGRNKLLVPLEGKELYRHGMEMLARFCRKREDCFLAVVSQYEEILEAVRRESILAVESPESSKGMAFSIRAGLRAFEEMREEDFVLFVVADQPFLQEETVERIVECAGPGVEVVSAAWKGRPGNPVMFSARLAPELLGLSGDEGGRKVAKRHTCRFVEAEERELWDVDTPDAVGRKEG